MTFQLSAVLDALDRHRPIHLGNVIQLLNSAHTFTWYFDLVHEYLPDDADEILDTDDIPRSIATFADRFSQRIFPLNETYIATMSDYVDNWDEEDLEDKPQSLLSLMVDGMPVELYGVDTSDFHELWETEPLAVCLLATLPSTDAILAYGTIGIRPSWVDMAARYVTTDILARIPTDGYGREHLLHAAAQCPDHDAAIAIRWILSATDNTMMDDCFDDEIYPFYGDTWDRDTIEQCRAIWAEAKPMLEGLKRFTDRLSNNPQREIAAIVDLMERNPLPKFNQIPDPP